MNIELFSDDYKVIKFLSSSPESIKFYKENAERINGIDNKIWPYRIEYPEQLLVFENQTIYVVETLDLFRQRDTEQPQDLCASVHAVEEFNIFKGRDGIINEHLRVPVRDIGELKSLENTRPTSEYYISSRSVKKICNLFMLNLYPNTEKSYNAIFYDKETADEYAKSVTKHFQKLNDTVSLITNFINRQ
jgi:hypothetical protein